MDEELLNELGIVAAKKHLLRFDLKLVVEPVIELDKLAPDEVVVMEAALKKAIETALRERPILIRAGREIHAVIKEIARVEIDPVRDGW